jgi:hypothetical protein
LKGTVRLLAAGEASLALVGLLWVWLRPFSISYRFDLSAVGLGFLAAAGFAVVNLTLYGFARRLGRPAPVLTFLEEEVFPLFQSLSTRDVVVLVVLAGVGEEILFRGAIQQEIGLWGASVLFGILHGPSRSLWVLAVWATLMGAALGLLYQASGNLVVPALAHALYDGVALGYVKTQTNRRCGDRRR